ncbi:hypothetical protein NQ315_012792 [Exocentrus adspersus]|uniref:DDE Tnp4 domain-containing protein n=1 Tax=Exocentrus adspersus TaxID=1586481 RepID=A0AAV8VBR9_9CUCU|nr:hypothetical protein NQ315_012792 [Exocentrus adspersus]
MAEDIFEIISEDDEEIDDYLRYLNPQRRLPVVRQRPNHFLKWEDPDFFARFRLSKLTVQRIINEVRENITNPTDRNNGISPELMVLLTLRFFATGSFLITVGDFNGYVQMPETVEECRNVRQGFYNIARFPRCIGAVDCTHVKIQSPGGEQAEIYRNRKQYFSINVQTICGPDLKIFNIVARWEGSQHDSTIFNNSNIRGRFERGEMRDGLLVGDSGYSIRKYLITPLGNPVTPAEQLFNESQIRTRNVVERSYRVWKRRFPILSLGIRLNIERVEAVIVACAVLHNIACEMGGTRSTIE